MYTYSAGSAGWAQISHLIVHLMNVYIHGQQCVFHTGHLVSTCLRRTAPTKCRAQQVPHRTGDSRPGTGSRRQRSSHTVTERRGWKLGGGGEWTCTRGASVSVITLTARHIPVILRTRQTLLRLCTAVTERGHHLTSHSPILHSHIPSIWGRSLGMRLGTRL